MKFPFKNPVTVQAYQKIFLGHLKQFYYQASDLGQKPAFQRVHTRQAVTAPGEGLGFCSYLYFFMCCNSVSGNVTCLCM